jgi:hypothetical protein
MLNAIHGTTVSGMTKIVHAMIGFP